MGSQDGTSAIGSLLSVSAPDPGPDPERLLGIKRCALDGGFA